MAGNHSAIEKQDVVLDTMNYFASSADYDSNMDIADDELPLHAVKVGVKQLATVVRDVINMEEDDFTSSTWDLVEANGADEVVKVGAAVEVAESAEAPSCGTLAPEVQAATKVPSSNPPMPEVLDRRPPSASLSRVFLCPSFSRDAPVLEE
ncbi:hypothetical protein Nepgr_011581 [Nepenthes gracilis]|uniref:Uncharacterized protein n=1 Tax=Nepenthes gracilis TaxID=150966 RepID=A0AAD3SEB8_NEPGR|nr:hypothetical protein Nepgr_011581 [Nepenthes gracilis]